MASARASAPVSRIMKEEEAVPRCHSLFDLETDKLLKHNQVSGTGKDCPGWTASKYKICGSFVDVLKGEKQVNGSTTTGSRLSQNQTQLQNGNRKGGLEKKDSFFDDPEVDEVVKFDAALHLRDSKNGGANGTTSAIGSHITNQTLTNSVNNQNTIQTSAPTPEQQIQQQQQQLNQSMTNILANLTSAQNDLTKKHSALFQNLNSVSLLKRQSLLDFEKTLQYFSPNKMPSYQNLVINGNLFGSFLSHGHSFNNILNANNLNSSSFDSTPTSESAENNFDIEQIKHVDVVEHENDVTERELSLKRKLSAKKLESNIRCKKRGKWSEVEDQVLQNLASTFVERKEKINFKKIADKLPGRTAKQCREHWLSTLNPDLKKGRWTKGEEIKLLDLMIAHGKSWSVIAKQIPGRAEHSVKAKGRLMLGERLKSIPQNAQNYNGTDEQKQKLFQLHQQLGADFDEISKQSGFVVSPAKIERSMLAMCSCASCVTLVEKIKGTNSPNLLQGWTKIKAGEIKKQILKKSNKYSSPELFGAINLESEEAKNGAESENQVNEIFMNASSRAVALKEEKQVNRLNSFSRLSMYKREKNNATSSLSNLRKSTSVNNYRKATNSVPKAENEEEEEFTSAVPMLY